MFKYIDLPPVPVFLIEPINDILAKPVLDTGSKFGYFQSKKVKNELEDWVRQNISKEGFIQYQIIMDGIKRHIDGGNRKTALNYILQTGGKEVYTTHHYPDGSLMQAVNIQPFRWHLLKTDILHTVSGIESARVSIGIGVNHEW